MYETLMETAVRDENYAQALAAVKRNGERRVSIG